jgi:hypothetical protein
MFNRIPNPEATLVASPPDTPIFLPMSELAARETYFRKGKQEAFLEYLDRANAGSATAQAVVSFMYLSRWVNDKSYLDKAASWAGLSADQGSAYGSWVCAWALLEQHHVRNGMSRLFEASERGFSPALYDLGMFLFLGVVLPKDINAGMSLFESAAALGHYTARRSLEAGFKLGVRGQLRRFWTIVVQPILKPLRFIHWIFFTRKFTEKNLVYVRSLHVRNSILRDVMGKEVSFELEEQLDKLVAKTSWWRRFD